MMPGVFWDLCLLLFAEASAVFKIEHEKKGLPLFYVDNNHFSRVKY